MAPGLLRIEILGMGFFVFTSKGILASGTA